MKFENTNSICKWLKVHYLIKSKIYFILELKPQLPEKFWIFLNIRRSMKDTLVILNWINYIIGFQGLESKLKLRFHTYYFAMALSVCHRHFSFNIRMISSALSISVQICLLQFVPNHNCVQNSISIKRLHVLLNFYSFWFFNNLNMFNN